jgi:xanthine dehydrogenase accessory factor
LLAQATAAIDARASQRLSFGDPAVDIFVEVYLPPPTLIIVGGVQIAIALASFAKTLGYRTIIIDPRHAFASETRFSHVDQLYQRWPQDVLSDIPLNVSTAVALLTHDPKIDDPALEIVLPSPAFYVGALGSRKTHARRVARLGEAGMDPLLIERIRGPIGLDINARTPEEIALAVMAEIVQARAG